MDSNRQALDADPDPDSDQLKLCRSDRIRIYNTGEETPNLHADVLLSLI